MANKDIIDLEWVESEVKEEGNDGGRIDLESKEEDRSMDNYDSSEDKDLFGGSDKSKKEEEYRENEASKEIEEVTIIDSFTNK